MAGPLFYDRVLETLSSFSGTGSYTALGGAVTGYQAWSVVGNTNTAFYRAEAVDANGNPSGGWEVGIGTYSTTGPALARTTILRSSNSDAAVNWSSANLRIALIEFPASVANQCCTVTHSTTQSIANAAEQAVVFDTETDDPSAMHSTASNTSRINCLVPGWYFGSGFARFASNATGIRDLYVKKNGGTRFGENSCTPVSGNDTVLGIAFGPVFCAAGDYFEMFAYQSSGAGLNITAVGDSPRFSLGRLGP